MQSRDDLLTLNQRLSLSDEARSIIDQVRTSDPARRVRSGRGNVSGRYPSKKMGVTIQKYQQRVIRPSGEVDALRWVNRAEYPAVHPDRAGSTRYDARPGTSIPSDHSVRRLATGSVRIARTAAGTVASSVAERRTSQGTAIICGSVGLTS